MAAKHSTVPFTQASMLLRHMNSEVLCNAYVRCIGDIRRLRLNQLREEQGLSFSEMNERLGRLRRDATLSQIANAAPNSGTGRVRQMGDDQARLIEEKFGLPIGWMDRDPDFDVMERQLQFMNQQRTGVTTPWPFPGISLSQVQQGLSAEDRAEIVGFIKGLLRARSPDSSEKQNVTDSAALESTHSEEHPATLERGKRKPRQA
jgi:hypothetical protein